ncbi:hypothetical protein CABS01_05369 [Colletotrichum abscissum]|uniref:uncharacterized protein n=1 Tax=Colletotrichum abscissum TaxID=1671311 RepID=UPI0027D629D5|nr:uncharacterized protein CABS01_05369 [Colletotrichum abscissum]KAK1520864.1 hypothetical protein CABS01_05369 [Colletotrichum abscissum]
MAGTYLTDTITERATHQGLQQSKSCGFKVQHIRPQPYQLGDPQYNSQMAVDTLVRDVGRNVQQSAWDLSHDFSARLASLGNLVRFLPRQCFGLSCLKDFGVFLQKSHVIGHVSTNSEKPSPAVTSSGSRPFQSVSARPRKRLKSSDDDSGRDNEDPKASMGKRTKGESTQCHFACPFWRLDPNNHRPCYSAKLSEIRYVKQHLLRRHVQPFYCPCCMELFDNYGDRDHHVRQGTCVIRLSSEHRPTGITEDQKMALRCWSARRGSTREDQWFEIWDITFPDVPHPISPYIDEQVFGQPHFELIPERSSALTVDEAHGMLLSPWNANKDSTTLGIDAHKTSNNEELRLACPYYKAFPQIISSSRWRTCSGGGWTSVHRLK